MNTTKRNILVWDLPVRVGHWLMVGCFVVAWLTGESEEWRNVHVLAGGGLLGIALFRLVWGVVGSRYARFGDFVRGPRAAFEYLKGLLHGQARHYVGHNPAGGWAIVIVLVLAVVGGVSGWLNYQELGGEWLEEVHEVAVHVMLIVVFVHLAGVLIGSLAHRENLPRAMLTGYKAGPQEDAIARRYPVIAGLLVIWAIVVATALSG